MYICLSSLNHYWMYWLTSRKTQQKETGLIAILCLQLTQKTGSWEEARETHSMSQNQRVTFTMLEKPSTRTGSRQTARLPAIIFQMQNISAASGWELSHHFINQQPCYRLCSARRWFDMKQCCPGGVSFLVLSKWKASIRDTLYLLGRWYFQAPHLKLKSLAWHLERSKQPLFLSCGTTAFSKSLRSLISPHLHPREVWRYVQLQACNLSIALAWVEPWTCT